MELVFLRNVLSGRMGLEKMVLAFFITFCCFFANNLAAQGNIEAGKNKVSMCVGCHGIPNYKTAFPKTYRVPRIAGQKASIWYPP